MKKIWMLLLLTAAFFYEINAQGAVYSLKFDSTRYTTQVVQLNGRSFSVRAFEHIVYVARPVDTQYQVMNIYIPEEYFNGKMVNGYTAGTAPVFFPNKVGGYYPARPAGLDDKQGGMMPPLNGQMAPGGANRAPGMPPVNREGPASVSAVIMALSKGYVVASAGARGRTLSDGKGNFTGKAPAGIVDLKAAIRYLKFNDLQMPGDAGKIISNGTSAGGAMSSLLGATGNHKDYLPYLKELGAANATDDVFAVSAYCPITNLDNADMAYEWQFNGINTYQKGAPFGSAKRVPDTLNATQISISGELANAFPSYLNSLKLKDISGKWLTLGKTGEGSFKELMKQLLVESAQRALDKGADLSSFRFLTINQQRVEKMDYTSYLQYIGRQKTPPAFDATDISSGENMLFGTAKIDKQHFTLFSQQHTTIAATRADKRIVRMMNPMVYVGKPGAKVARNWRIRHGTKDKDTGLAISLMMALLLRNNGYTVNFEYPWDIPHSGDYDLEQLFSWIDQVSR